MCPVQIQSIIDHKIDYTFYSHVLVNVINFSCGVCGLGHPLRQSILFFCYIFKGTYYRMNFGSRDLDFIYKIQCEEKNIISYIIVFLLGWAGAVWSYSDLIYPKQIEWINFQIFSNIQILSLLCKGNKIIASFNLKTELYFCV